MTYFKTALTSVAAIALAAPAFAGQQGKTSDHTMMDKAEMITQMETQTQSKTTIETRTDVMGAMDDARLNDTVGEILQSDGEIIDDADQEIIVDMTEMTESEFRTEDDDGMVRDNAIVVPGSAGTITTVTCPAGTEAQTNMTCLITGDFEFSD